MDRPDVPLEVLCQVARDFSLPEIADVCELPGGHINRTFRVTEPASGKRFVLQQINRSVFENADAVMQNIARAFEVGVRGPNLIPTRGGLPALDGEIGYWRAFDYLEQMETLGSVHGKPDLAHAAASAVAEFHQSLDTAQVIDFQETLPAFHHTPKRLAALWKAAESAKEAFPERLAEVTEELNQFRAAEARLGELQALWDAGKLTTRVVHNDTKLANIMVDPDDLSRRCLIDLDTVMPGLVLHDFGDLVRSATPTAGEDDPEVGFDEKTYAALEDGFLSTAGKALSDLEKSLLKQAGWTITLETGSRFLADYLQGDPYFHTKHPTQNLDRTKSQLTLAKFLAP